MNATPKTTAASVAAPINTPSTPNTALAKYLDLNKWVNNDQAEYHWQGTLQLAQLPRIAALPDNTPAPSGESPSQVAVELSIRQSGSLLLWSLHTDGTLWQTCQRCLEPVAVPLTIDSEFALLQDESQAALVSEDTETILLDEITDDERLNLLAMIEDELLVALPLAPKHAQCHMAVTQAGELPKAAVQQDNPFAVLAALKN
ncbi:YceD family protein [Faucicola atlantae]|uniref:YceD family protein n=1 Tax=Faucicola atlantae TaxID=34059 RepID=UPI0025B0F824|nr:YceD family protein [Moraxella atlantae]